MQWVCMSLRQEQRKCSSAVLISYRRVRSNVKIMCSVTKRNASGMFVSKLDEASDRVEHTITSFSVKKIKTQSTSVRRGRWRRRRIGRVTRSATRRGIGVSPHLIQLAGGPPGPWSDPSGERPPLYRGWSWDDDWRVSGFPNQLLF